MVEVRAATAADAALVSGVLAAAFEPLRARYTPGAFAATVTPPAVVRKRITEGPVWVALVDGTVVGTVSARLDDQGCYIRGMGVSPRARGCGVGAALMTAINDYATAEAADRLWLLTTDFLDAALRLYERHGFSFIPTDADLHGTPLVCMEKRL